jgi:hypothetical protein
MNELVPMAPGAGSGGRHAGASAVARTMIAALFALLISACGDRDPAGTDVPGPSPDSLSGVWSGTFPCSNCPGIDTTLWLRPDGRFFLEQRYLADDVSDEQRLVAYGLGRWQWQGEGHGLVLSGEGPQREFTRPDENTLFMHTASPIEHRLDRSGTDFNFDGVLAMQAVVRAGERGYVLSECLTGYEVPVANGGDYRRFAEQFRSIVPRGESAPLEFEGHFNWDEAGPPASVTIERFVRLLSEGGC